MSEIDILGTGEKVIVRSDGTIDGDISGSGDFVKTSGKDNLKSRVILRLLIRRGELESDPNIGSELYTLKGMPFSTVVQEWVKMLTYDALIRDPMIKDIENLTVIKDESVQGRIRILGNIVTVKEWKIMSEEPHDYLEDQDVYQLNKNYVRSINEVKGFQNQNLVFFTQGIDYESNGNSIQFIGARPNINSAFLITYSYFNVDESKENATPLTFPFNLGGT